MGNDTVSLILAAVMFIGVLIIIVVVTLLMRKRSQRSYRNRR